MRESGENMQAKRDRTDFNADKKYEISRLEYIRLKLQRGDKKRIAEEMGVHPEWVSQVIRGVGISEPILVKAERIILERENAGTNI